MPVGDGCFIVGTGRGMIEWRGRDMGFVMGVLVRYVIFTVAIFMVGGIMGYFFDGYSCRFVVRIKCRRFGRFIVGVNLR